MSSVDMSGRAMRLLAVVVLACVVKQDLVVSQCTTRYCDSELITGAQTTTAASVGYIRTTGGNGEGAPCVFPFIYKGVEYNNCTFVDFTKRWCATTNNYENNKLWGECIPTSVGHVRTTGGNGEGAHCLFPFIYKGVVYNNCTFVDYTKRWCATTNNYDINKLWGECIPTSLEDVRTTGGNGEGAPCVFPFIYKGVEYNNCTFVESTKRWCATTNNYDINNLWGACIPTARGDFT